MLAMKHTLNLVFVCSPLGRPHEANGKQIAIFDPNVQLIAQRYNKTPAQVILRYTVRMQSTLPRTRTHQ